MMSISKPIERKRLTDQIVDRVVLLVANKKLRPGDRIPTEKQLMKQFGVGRSSIREAIGALVLCGVLSSRSGYGTFVNVAQSDFPQNTLRWRVNMGQEKIGELVEARIALEQAVARLAALKADKNDIAEMSNCLAQLKKAINGGQKTLRLKADMSFHFALAKASHNNTLCRFLSEFRNMMELWVKQAIRTESIYADDIVISHHQEILNAVESHDVERAQIALRQHLEASANNLSVILLHKSLGSTF